MPHLRSWRKLFLFARMTLDHSGLYLYCKLSDVNGQNANLRSWVKRVKIHYGMRFSKLIVESLLVVSILTLSRSPPPNVVGNHSTVAVVSMHPPVQPRRVTYHDFEYYLNEWLQLIFHNTKQLF